MKDLSKKTSAFLNVTVRDHLDNLALLIIRLTFGSIMLLQHGLTKAQNFESIRHSFPDPLHLGSPQMSLILAIFAELVCSGLVVVGFMTRLAAIPLFITMFVAVTVIHGQDAFEKKELAVLYMAASLVLILRGSGKLSIDGILGK